MSVPEELITDADALADVAPASMYATASKSVIICFSKKISIN